MDFSDVIILINTVAVVASPFIAIHVTQRLEATRAKKSRQIELVKSLLRSRARSLSSDHIGALNIIPFEFEGFPNVIKAWTKYVAALREEASSVPEQQNAALTKQHQAFVGIVSELLTALSIKHQAMDILEQTSQVESLGNEDSENQMLRQLAIDVLSGRSAVRVTGQDGKKARITETAVPKGRGS